MNKQRLFWKSEMRLRRDKSGDAVGRPRWRFVIARRSWRGISLWKTGDRHRKKKGAHKRAVQGLLVKGDSSTVSLNLHPLRFSVAGRTCDGRGV